MTKKSVKNWIALLGMCLLVSFFASDLNAQITQTPEQFAAKLEIMAPNRPAMERTTLDVDVFYAGDVKYKYSENLEKLNEWKANHPAEFGKCYSMLTNYMENADSLTPEQLASDVYKDLNAQWVMLMN